MNPKKKALEAKKGESKPVPRYMKRTGNFGPRKRNPRFALKEHEQEKKK